MIGEIFKKLFSWFGAKKDPDAKKDGPDKKKDAPPEEIYPLW